MPRKKPSAGSDLWRCKCSGKPPVKKKDRAEAISEQTDASIVDKIKNNALAKEKPKSRNRTSKLCNCSASFRIRFPHGYKHDADKNINVDEFGDKKATVTWNSRHNHIFDSRVALAKSDLSKDASDRLDYVVASLGMQWKQIQRLQTEQLVGSENNASDMFNSALQKYTYNHWHYQNSEGLTKLAKKHSNVETSLKNWTRCIRLMDGFADYAEKFYAVHDLTVEEEVKSSRGEKAWSFVFMSKWQRELLQKNSTVITVDSTYKTCHGLHSEEQVSLFAIVVKNHVTGQGAPAAFMLTNAATAPVIADFFRRISSYCPFKPGHVVTGCGAAETVAIRGIWGESVPITYCRWHVMTAFSRRSKDKIVARADKDKIWTEAKSDFAKILGSKEICDADEKIEQFRSKYASQTMLVKYAESTWFAKKEFIIDACSNMHVEHRDTRTLTEAFHRVLKSKYVGKPRLQRPDVLLFKLLTVVVPAYRGAERRTQMRIPESKLDKAEENANEEAENISEAQMHAIVQVLCDGKFKVDSLHDHREGYTVGTTLAGSERDSCTCAVFVKFRSKCKHVYLIERWWEASLSIAPGEEDCHRHVSDDGNEVEVDDIASDLESASADDPVSVTGAEPSMDLECEYPQNTVDGEQSVTSTECYEMTDECRLARKIPKSEQQVDASTITSETSVEEFTEGRANPPKQDTEMRQLMMTAQPFKVKAFVDIDKCKSAMYQQGTKEAAELRNDLMQQILSGERKLRDLRQGSVPNEKLFCITNALKSLLDEISHTVAENPLKKKRRCKCSDKVLR